MSIFRQLRSILGKEESLPKEVVAAPATPTERRRQKRLVHKGRRILIIDDSATVVAALKKILRSAGCVVSEAADAEAGLELIQAEKPDLVFLDIVLPGMNGFAALRQMRRVPATASIPVIMISGNEQATEQFYAKRIGADDFMKKPFSRHEVFARIESLIAANKLASLDGNTTVSPAPEAKTPPSVNATPPAPSKPPAPSQASTIRHEHQTGTLSNETVSRMTQIEARQQLTAMGLQYYSQEQFLAAIKRDDKLAVDLFIIGGGVSINIS